MSRFYLSLDSTYRNRNEYPHPSNFVALISQSGTRGASTALDPISFAAPSSLVFTPFVNFSGNVVSYSTSPGSSGVVLRVTAGTASQTTNYYNGIQMQLSAATNTYYPRITSWRYLYTSGGFDYFSVFFDSFNPSSMGALTYTMYDPSVFSDPNNILAFIPSSISAQNFFAGNYLYNQTLNQWLTITFYDSEAHYAIASPKTGDNYVPGTWTSMHTYLVRKVIPLQYGNITGGASNSSQIVIVGGSAALIGSFIRITSTPAGESRRIVAFDMATNTATVSPAFSIPTAGVTYEILGFSVDNVSNIIFNFSEVTTSMAVCYKVVLLNIAIPNGALKNAPGGRAIFYPYLFVSLENVNSAEGMAPNMIASNNPNSNRMLFRISINDSTNEITSPIIRLSGSGMVQHAKIRPTDSFKLSVYLPDGSLFLTETQDNSSPASPNPLIQITALFYFERIM